MMNIALLTESLGSGGAERQVCTLASEFKLRGHRVCVATYAPGDFYKPALEREDIEHCFLGGRGRVSWALNVRWFLRSHGQDVVLAFLAGPSAYAEIAGLPRRSWGLVVSERSAGINSWVRARLHLLADYIVLNSHSARIAIGNKFPDLRSKLATIYNAVHFVPCLPVRQNENGPRELRLLVAARIDRNKNPSGLLAAVRSLRASLSDVQLRVDWFGCQNAEPEVFRCVLKEIADAGLQKVFFLHPPTVNIHNEILQASAIILPSYSEGLPNAVCEGMALGKPILMSAVCDAGNLVEEGVNGFLFDPHSPKSIAKAIHRFAGLPREDIFRMGEASRRRALELFDLGHIAERYLRILEAAAAHRSVPPEHLNSDMPDTTYGKSDICYRGSHLASPLAYVARPTIPLLSCSKQKPFI